MTVFELNIISASFGDLSILPLPSCLSFQVPNASGHAGQPPKFDNLINISSLEFPFDVISPFLFVNSKFTLTFLFPQGHCKGF